VGTSDGAITNATYSSTDGGVIVYDGSGDYVVMDQSNPAVFANNTDMTIEIWAAKDQDNSNGYPMLMHYRGTSGYPSLSMHVYGTSGNYSDSGFMMYADSDQDGHGSGYSELFSNRYHTPDPNGWAQHTGTYTGSSGSHTSKYYINGYQEGSTATSSHSHVWYKGTNLDTGGIVLGSSAHSVGNTTHGFEGKMSIVKIYNRELTAAEVLQNYNAHKSRFGL
jgi:hypothetical protein